MLESIVSDKEEYAAGAHVILAAALDERRPRHRGAGALGALQDTKHSDLQPADLKQASILCSGMVGCKNRKRALCMPLMYPARAGPELAASGDQNTVEMYRDGPIMHGCAADAPVRIESLLSIATAC